MLVPVHDIVPLRLVQARGVGDQDIFPLRLDPFDRSTKDVTFNREKIVASALSGAFGGLLAYGILYMDGVAGLRGWRWYALPFGPDLLFCCSLT